MTNYIASDLIGANFTTFIKAPAANLVAPLPSFPACPTLMSVMMAPSAAGTNHTMFMRGTSSGAFTIRGVKKEPSTMPMGLAMPISSVARWRWESLNQCWDTLVGTHEMNGQATPVRAWTEERGGEGGVFPEDFKAINYLAHRS